MSAWTAFCQYAVREVCYRSMSERSCVHGQDVLLLEELHADAGTAPQTLQPAIARYGI